MGDEQTTPEESSTTFCYFITHPELKHDSTLAEFVDEHQELTAADFKDYFCARDLQRIFERHHPKHGYLQHTGLRRLITKAGYLYHQKLQLKKHSKRVEHIR